MEKSNLPRVTDILRAAGLIDFSKVPVGILEGAQNFGSAFHMARHLWDMETLDINTLSESLIPRLESWKRFKRDYNFTVKLNESERQFVSKKYGFIGKPDLWPIIQGKRTLIDTKTSIQMYAATEIQTIAYQILLEENGIKIDRRWGVQVPDNGICKIEPYTEISDKTTFLNCLGVYNYKKRKELL